MPVTKIKEGNWINDFSDFEYSSERSAILSYESHLFRNREAFSKYSSIKRKLMLEKHENPSLAAMNIFENIWLETFEKKHKGKGESTDDCIGRKISILADEPRYTSHDQVVAVAHRMCGAPKPKGKK